MLTQYSGDANLCAALFENNYQQTQRKIVASRTVDVVVSSQRDGVIKIVRPIPIEGGIRVA